MPLVYILYLKSVEDCLGRWSLSFPLVDRKLVMVGVFALMRAIWLCRNGIVFNRDTSITPIKIIKLVNSWIGDWAQLQTKEAKGKVLRVGARVVEQVASEVYKASQGWRPGVLRLGG